ncbi:MAG: hypothetical protein A2487_01220 [Candidatus Raymondbacteria bacterium RifOxyC12_full_50_8]|uniref:Uncharacterized protein n=1 Tax=Candidatus Raymondbacteria bacterium RIFOXYD12_FULL_49_13 TaxID=1817890 RepID=A0A1F7F9L8_UNCRA|nr:MAG: hypothetical protein A2248_09710 [Candidatus Raymondbacteria bacterium RIFOXYA2_FULL_49_16]OGJ91838.1 MAG: hypothetical protein A2350_21430 [Candidatus Raymondbacteria bacterium RifOxyB12_full_50_8]OGJ95503.1 MAG: hypothetical protein A2487_01220 [Candidatus Raymondbacteria bacterium RifOxyC12_full_50_8]OGJ97179.1 MAG: hypothetical protein A2453_10355 [Candidatus Raymondbacteria bacterium RIFOXYC2_FULL_50_21]OGK03206.1 MAG: hypothetical protein A2519_05105 [Candidatus Raymondbacteria ba
MRGSSKNRNKYLNVPKMKYLKPAVESDLIYETQALGCAQCLNRDPETAVGWDGGCGGESINNY